MVWITSPTADGLMRRMRWNDLSRSSATSTIRAPGEEETAPPPVTPRSSGAVARPKVEPLQPSGCPVAQRLKHLDALATNPVELNDPAGTDERFVPVEGALTAAEGNQGAVQRGNFCDHVLHIMGRAQEP